MAEVALESLKQGGVYWRKELPADILIWLREPGSTLADLGTSEEEIQQLLKENQLARAKKMLSCARLPVDPRKREHVREVRKLLKEAGALFGDIGTSEKELSKLTGRGKT